MEHTVMYYVSKKMHIKSFDTLELAFRLCRSLDYDIDFAMFNANGKLVWYRGENV